ncbi:MAG: CDP-alcohol phosphatidyltransferase family protein [Chloroflexi bacterium]|nr:CDP-alcohol phosphatidyltransferase family protein [Chloroflexota bacterium]
MSVLRYAVPNGLTTLNLLLGFLAILHASQGDLLGAAGLILAGSVLDIFDGMAARLLHAGSRFGAQLDSYADLVTSGAATAQLVYLAFFSMSGWWGVLVSTLPLLTGAFRLVRYDLQADEQKRRAFEGFPITWSSMLLAGFVLFADRVWQAPPPGLVALLVVIDALAMVSTIPYSTNAVIEPKRILRNWRGWAFLVGVVGAIVAPAITFFVWTSLFLLSGVAAWAWRKYSSR